MFFIQVNIVSLDIPLCSCKWTEITRQIVVQTIHERKFEMARRAGGFVGLSGGFGTFEEVNTLPINLVH